MNNHDALVIGYGQSGSGKTSSLIYKGVGKEATDGALVAFLNNPDFAKHASNLVVSMYVIQASFDT